MVKAGDLGGGKAYLADEGQSLQVLLCTVRDYTGQY